MLRLPGMQFGRLAGKMRCKGCSFLFTRCHTELAAVGGHDFLGNEKPEAEAGRLALVLILILPACQRVKKARWEDSCKNLP